MENKKKSKNKNKNKKLYVVNLPMADITYKNGVICNS